MEDLASRHTAELLKVERRAADIAEKERHLREEVLVPTQEVGKVVAYMRTYS